MPGDGRAPFAGVPPLDYRDHSAASWAAFPGRPAGAAANEAALLPPGAVQAGSLPADCFFIHPTGYFGGSTVQPFDGGQASAAADRRTSLMMAGQASAFNARCRVYAPRYRQQSGRQDVDRASGSFGAAYADVRAAFRHFLGLTAPRPLLIGAHSQGCRLGVKLLAEEVDARPEVAARLVAAYLIGGPVTEEYVRALRRVRRCSAPADTGVVIAWNTLRDMPAAPYPCGTYKIDSSGALCVGAGRNGDGTAGGLTLAGHPHGFWAGAGNHLYCVSPVTWRAGDQPAAPPEAYGGIVHPDGRWTVGDSPAPALPVISHAGWEMTGIRAPVLAGELRSRVELGYLILTPPPAGSAGAALFPDDPMARMPAREQVLHNLDYALWYPNIRDNVALRVDAFLRRPGRSSRL